MMPKRSIYLLISMIFFLSMLAVATETSTQKDELETIKEKRPTSKSDKAEKTRALQEYILARKDSIEDYEACIAEAKVCIEEAYYLLRELGTYPFEDLRPLGLNFAVTPNDEPYGDAYTWREAKKICEDKGMSLPTIDELGEIVPDIVETA